MPGLCHQDRAASGSYMVLFESDSTQGFMEQISFDFVWEQCLSSSLTDVVDTVRQTPRSEGAIVDSFAFIKQIDHVAVPASLGRKEKRI